jgi:hypothetical protein
MTQHAVFSTQVRSKVGFNLSGRGASYPTAIHGNAEEQFTAKGKSYLHDSAFLADRGCLDGSNLPRHPAPAHRY